MSNAPELRDETVPVGGSHRAAPRSLVEAHAVIRRRVGHMFEEREVRMLVIQYGESVHPENASALVNQPGVDGALVGGASLKAHPFLAIVRAGIVNPQTGTFR